MATFKSQITDHSPQIKPPAEELYDTIVHVKVGREKKDFGMHKGLLCYHSTFFNSALNGKFKEASTGVIELPDDDVRVFEKFNIWLYTGRLYDYDESQKSTAPSSQLVIKIYLFADCRRIEGLKNAAMDLLDWKEGPTPADIKLIYESTPEGCKLRARAVDSLTSAYRSWLKEGESTSLDIANSLMRKPLDFVADFVKKSLLDDHGDARQPERARHQLCKYHDHTSTRRCWYFESLFGSASPSPSKEI